MAQAGKISPVAVRPAAGWWLGLVIDLATRVHAETTTSSAIARWPEMPAGADHAARTDPGAAATPAQPAMMVCAPRARWAIWIWLSSLTPSPITVSSSAPRSTVVLAPISTSLPRTTRPVCGIWTQAPDFAREAEAVGADDHARTCRMQSLADHAVVVDGDVGIEPCRDRCERRARRAVGPDHHVLAEHHVFRSRRRVPPARWPARVQATAAMRMDARTHRGGGLNSCATRAKPGRVGGRSGCARPAPRAGRA